jgi:transcription initiation protein SPT3
MKNQTMEMHCELALIIGFQLGVQKAPYLEAAPAATLSEPGVPGRVSLPNLKLYSVPGEM